MASAALDFALEDKEEACERAARPAAYSDRAERVLEYGCTSLTDSRTGVPFGDGR